MNVLIKLVTLTLFVITLAACNQETPDQQGSAPEQTDNGGMQDGSANEGSSTDPTAPATQ